MSFSDPQTITLSGILKTLPRVPSDKPTNIGKFYGDEGNTIVSVHQNSSNSRFRREFRITLSKVIVDPLSNMPSAKTASCIVAFDEPKYGFTDAELIAAYAAITASLSAGSNAKLTQMLTGEL